MAGQKHETDQWETEQAHLHVVSNGAQYLLVRHSHTWRPPTDVMADDDRLVIIVEVAGMRDSDFHVTLAGQKLTISGARPTREPAHAAYQQLEVRYGEFRIDIAIPWAIDDNQVLARYDDGFLRVELPRSQPQRITVVDVEKPPAE